MPSERHEGGEAEKLEELRCVRDHSEFLVREHYELIGGLSVATSRRLS
eukprot:CAMPEP_0170617284 /NCGR_PEP_ID=MMETSP0224-20130122/26333_1 /TAXON_ID=285029 /ORGANISM="Togula jolla, Strain CCCM 725" /LENGTH=47 /DNA_ID= /DNA_START= /DNA_END= /DNA_ORIENTATION=